MNNDFYQSNVNCCRQYYQNYNYNNERCCNYNNRCDNYQYSSCCRPCKPVRPCCPQNDDDCNPATITIGSTTTLPAGSNATVTNSGTAENVILNFGIPRGATGATGPVGPAGATGPAGPAGENGIDGEDGAAATVTVGTTTTSDPGTEAIVTNSGTPNAAILNFVIPRGATGATGPTGATGATGPAGADGEDGAAATITVGTTTTGEAGTEASVTNVGTENAAILNFVIPRGEDATITPGAAVDLLAATATIDDVIATVNELITSLTNAGFLA